MSKGNNLQSLFCGILFCISVAALVIACLAFAKKDCGKGEHYEERLSTPYPACEECPKGCDTSCCPRAFRKPNPWGQCDAAVPSQCCNIAIDSEQCAECIEKCTSLNPPAWCTPPKDGRGSPHN